MLARRAAAAARRGSVSGSRPGKAAPRPLGRLCLSLVFLGLLALVVSGSSSSVGSPLSVWWPRPHAQRSTARSLHELAGGSSRFPGLLKHRSLRRMQHAKETPASRLEADALAKSALADVHAMDNWVDVDMNNLTDEQVRPSLRRQAP